MCMLGWISSWETLEISRWGSETVGQSVHVATLIEKHFFLGRVILDEKKCFSLEPQVEIWKNIAICKKIIWSRLCAFL